MSLVVQDALQGRGQVFRRAGLLPGFRQIAFDHAHGFAGAGAAAHGVFGAGVKQHLFLKRVKLALARTQPQGAAPHALRAQRQRSGNLAASRNAACRQHRDFIAAGLHHLRHQHHGGDFAGVAAGLRALRDDDFNTRRHVARGVFALAAHGANHHVAGAQLSHHVGRRRAQRADHEFHLRVRQRHAQQAARAVRRHVAASIDDFFVDAGAFVERQLGHPGVAQDFVHEGAVRRRDQFLQVFRAALSLFVVGRRDDDVNAVGPALRVLVDPTQLGFKLLGRKGGRAEHAKAAGLGDFHHHVATMRESEDGQLAAQFFTEEGSHFGCLSRYKYSSCLRILLVT